MLSKIDNNFDYVCCIYPTSVFVTEDILEDAFKELEKDESATSIASVIQYSHPIQRSLSKESKYLTSNHPECYNLRSQDLEVNYHDAGQFYIFKPQSVLEEQRLINSICTA